MLIGFSIRGLKILSHKIYLESQNGVKHLTHQVTGFQ